MFWTSSDFCPGFKARVDPSLACFPIYVTLKFGKCAFKMYTNPQADPGFPVRGGWGNSWERQSLFI